MKTLLAIPLVLVIAIVLGFVGIFCDWAFNRFPTTMSWVAGALLILMVICVSQML